MSYVIVKHEMKAISFSCTAKMYAPCSMAVDTSLKFCRIRSFLRPKV